MNDKFTVINVSIICFNLYLFTSACMALGESNLDECDLEKSKDLELKPMFTENHGDQVSKANLELKEFYDKYDSLCENTLKKYDSLLKTVNNYVQRYVSLFLVRSDIFDQEEKESMETISVALEITVSFEDLAYLRNVSKILEESSVLKVLSRLDTILSKAVRRREESYFESILRFLTSKIYYLGLSIHRLFLSSNFYNFIPFLIILLLTCFIYKYSSRKSVYFHLGIILNSMMFWDGLKLYRRRIKDAEVELQSLKLQVMPEECDPANFRWYHKVMHFYSGDRCLEYYKNMNRNPVDEVSFFQSIVDTYSLHTIKTTFRLLGASIRDFTGEISALWPTPLQWVVNLPLIFFLIILLVFLIVIFCGKRFKLSFFGASVEIGDSAEIKNTRVINKTGPRLTTGYRPLRTLSKSRFLRRSELRSPKDRKSNLKAPKSECTIEYNEHNDLHLAMASDSEIAKKKDRPSLLGQ